MPPEVIGGRLFGGLRPRFCSVGFADTSNLRHTIPQTLTAGKNILIKHTPAFELQVEGVPVILFMPPSQL